MTAIASATGEPRPLAVRVLQLWLWLVLLAAVASTASVAWLMLDYVVQPGPGEHAHLPLPPPAELGVDQLPQELHALGAIRDPAVLHVLLRLLDAGPRLRNSRTKVDPALSIRDQLPRLMRGYGRPLIRLTFPEGFDRYDLASRLGEYGIAAEQEFVAITQSPQQLARWKLPANSAEGYLFPDTYELRMPMPPGAVADRLVKGFRRRVESLFQKEAKALETLRAELGFDTHDVLVLASIVEKEAQKPSERATIAGVFLNRLRDPSFRPHRLQADPTVAYGCRVQPEGIPSCAEYDGRRVTPAMVRDPSNPYNTYRHDGLPPGPICNPGLDSIRAVLHPKEHGYFYFVAAGDGSHRFSATLEEHNRAIQRGRDGR